MSKFNFVSINHFSIKQRDELNLLSFSNPHPHHSIIPNYREPKKLIPKERQQENVKDML